MPAEPRSGSSPRGLLAVAALAVGFAAVDTYVVVLALPDMMSSVGLNLDELQRAAPIVSGFLLGYVAMLPLIGRLADLRGRVPVLVGSLVVFAFGSLVTAASYDLTTMVIGRFLQGVGGGGLVPATLSLVAQMWAADRRGLPLGIVGAVQELGSVLGPLYGAVVLAVSTWHTIFWLNLAVGMTLAGVLIVLGRSSAAERTPATVDSTSHIAGPLPDVWGVLLGIAGMAALALVMAPPERLQSGLTTGLAYVSYIGDSRWSTPMAAACYVLAALFVARLLTARRPLLDVAGLRDLRTQADLPGAVLLGLSLAGIVVAFATADPAVQVLSPAGPWLLMFSAATAALFWWRQRLAVAPLVPTGALRATSAWAALVVSFFVGSSLIAALVDIPVFARVTTYPDSQLGAALVLVRFLAALPVGALLGGYLVRRVAPGPLSAAGMLLAASGFVWMTQWGATTLHEWSASIPLVVCGLGFGLSIAPINSALLAATSSDVHGIASALLVVARTIGMLVGISALTTIGLRRFYAVSATLPTAQEVCGSNSVCPAYLDQLELAGIAQMHAVFWGAAAAAVLAAVLSVVLVRTSPADQRSSRVGLSV